LGFSARLSTWREDENPADPRTYRDHSHPYAYYKMITVSEEEE
jgi:hypothetical protein